MYTLTLKQVSNGKTVVSTRDYHNTKTALARLTGSLVEAVALLDIVTRKGKTTTDILNPALVLFSLAIEKTA